MNKYFVFYRCHFYLSFPLHSVTLHSSCSRTQNHQTPWHNLRPSKSLHVPPPTCWSSVSKPPLDASRLSGALPVPSLSCVICVVIARPKQSRHWVLRSMSSFLAAPYRHHPLTLIITQSHCLFKKDKIKWVLTVHYYLAFICTFLYQSHHDWPPQAITPQPSHLLTPLQPLPTRAWWK